MNKLSSLLLAAAFGFTALSCSKSADPNPNGGGINPIQSRDYVVEYRVSSNTALAASYIQYTDITGKQVSPPDLKLPFNLKFTRRLKRFDIITLGAFLPPTGPVGDITATLLLDGVVVDTQSTTNLDPVTAQKIIGQ